MQETSAFEHIDIVCFSLSRWDAPISSPAVSLAKEFAKSHRVFFIQHPYSYKDIILDPRARRRSLENIQDAATGVKVIVPPLTLPVNYLPEGKLYHLLSSVNSAIMLRVLRDTLVKNKISRYIFINFFDPFFYQNIPGEIGPVKYIYQCMDDISQVAYTRKHGLALENRLIRAADYTLCTSRELARIQSSLSPHVYFFPNGADTTLFNASYRLAFDRPRDMDFPDKKIIGFMGSIEYRTDFDLLKAVAERHRDKILYLIGPVYGSEHVKAGLTNMPNVIFAGPRNIESLPAYLQHFDCAIIPYKKNRLTASIYPLKINEYLAAGKPVVSTDFSEDIRSFSDVAYVADGAGEFINAIDSAIDENDEEKRERRLNVAALNSWPKRAEQFWDIISQK